MDLTKIPAENHDLAKRCAQLMDVFSSRVLSTVQVVLTSKDPRNVELRNLAKENPDKFMSQAIEQALDDLELLIRDVEA